MIETASGLKKLEAGDLVPDAFYNDGSAFNTLVDRVEAQNTTLGTKAPLASPTFTGTAKATANTNYSTPQIRNIHAGTADLTAGTSSLASGTIYLVYE